MNGNTHHPHPCAYCYQVLYSKGAHTRHVNEQHWAELEKEEAASKEIDEFLEQVNDPA